MKNLPPAWAIQPELRIELVSKFFEQNINTESPIKLLLKLGEFYDGFDMLEGDMQSIYNSFNTTDPDFNPYTSCLSFYLEEFFQNTKIKISINFLNFK